MSQLERLLNAPHAFGFFQAVRLLRRVLRVNNANATEATFARQLYFRSQVSRAFPSAEIDSIDSTCDQDGIPGYEITVNFLGLTGPQGTLPTHYSTAISQAEPATRVAVRGFFDLFNNRLTALFWDAWRQAHPFLAIEDGSSGSLQDCLLAFVGLQSPWIHTRQTGEPEVDPGLLAYFAPLLARRPISWAAARQILEFWTSSSVRIEQLQGGWIPFGESMRTQIGVRNCSLAGEFVLGHQHFALVAGLEISIGPLREYVFEQFLPGGDLHEPLKRLARFLFGPSLKIKCRLARRGEGLNHSDAVGAFTLTSRATPRRLGLNSWLLNRPTAATLDDCVLVLN